MARRAVLYLSIVALGVLTMLTAAVPSAVAKSKSEKTTEPLAVVVGHLALSGPASRLFLQEQGRQHYLLIEQDSKEGFIIVNVTEPNQPTIVKHIAWPNQASNGKLQLMKAGLALSTAPENSATPSAPAQSLNLLDLRDPADPKMIEGFNGVTSMLLDESRSLMYIANPEGLWILKYKQQENPASNPFGCPADGSSTTDPNCSY